MTSWWTPSGLSAGLLSTHVRRSGEDHRSLPDVLRELQAQLAGQEPAQVPGQSLSRPLHVVLQVRAFSCNRFVPPVQSSCELLQIYKAVLCASSADLVLGMVWHKRLVVLFPFLVHRTPCMYCLTVHALVLTVAWMQPQASDCFSACVERATARNTASKYGGGRASHADVRHLLLCAGAVGIDCPAPRGCHQRWRERLWNCSHALATGWQWGFLLCS